ncbi:MAG TPA: hemolysin family protein [bacterium]
MDSYLLSHLIIFIALIFTSMFFSAVETSLLSLPRALLARRAQGSGFWGLAFREWQNHPNRILTAILFGNNAVNTVATILAAYTGVHFAEIQQWNRAVTGTVVSVIVTFVIIVFGEVIPKVTARGNAERVANLLIIPIYLFDRFLTPLTWVLSHTVGRVFPTFGRSSVSLVTEEDIKHMIEMGSQSGTIQEQEKRMIHSVLEFTDTKVNEVMIPRTDMFSVDLKTNYEVLVEKVIQKGYSRVPVYKGSVDNIVGIIHTRDLLSIWKHQELIVLYDLLRKPFFVPESMRVDRLLREFQKGKVHMAIVVDEYGGTAGLVTLEDLMEEIVGEIRDEYDSDEEKALVKQVDGSWIIEADLSLDEVNKALGTRFLPKGEVASLGGYLSEKYGRVPKKNRVVDDLEAIFTVLEASDRKIIKVKVVKRSTPLLETEPVVAKPRKKRAKTPAAEPPPNAEPAPVESSQETKP